MRPLGSPCITMLEHIYPSKPIRVLHDGIHWDGSVSKAMGGLTCEPVAPVGALKCMLGSKYFSWKGVCCESFLDVQAYDTQR